MDTEKSRPSDVLQQWAIDAKSGLTQPYYRNGMFAKECRELAAEIEMLHAALTLAANRMDVLALDHGYGTTRRNIADDWAKEARAALGPNGLLKGARDEA